MRYIFSLGSNMGDRERNIRLGINFLSGLGIKISESSLYETSPVGMGPDTGPFINSVILIESGLPPEDFLKKIKVFEQAAGRDGRNSHMKPREIDIDILFVDDMNINTPSLRIPHPEIVKRRFVLEPLAEICPDIVHPTAGKTIRELLKNLKTDDLVEKI